MLFFALLSFKESSGQRINKIKFSNKLGNSIYYKAAEGTDDVEYCDLYFTSKNSSSTIKIKILQKHIEDTPAGEICYPDSILINQKVYEIKIHNYGKYITQKTTKGKVY